MMKFYREGGKDMSTIVVIDDTESIRTVCKKMLEKRGYEVLTSCDGESGLAILKKTPVDLVVLDLSLPGATGLEILNQIRKLSGKLPVIILTGQDIYSDVKELENSLTYFMSKGDGSTHLLAKIEEMIKKTDKIAFGDSLPA